MVQLVRHPQTKGRETDRPNLNHRATSRLYLKCETRRHTTDEKWPAAGVPVAVTAISIPRPRTR